MTDLIEFLRKNWAVLISAPAVFVLFAVLVAGVVAMLMRWHYERHIEILRERLLAKDELLEDYRQRLHLTPTDGTSYSKLNNAEVKVRALAVVAKIRAFLADIKTQERERSNRDSFPDSRNLTEEQRNAEWRRGVETMSQELNAQNIAYENQFKTDTLLLRDELLFRLPESAKGDRRSVYYERQVNRIGMQEVVDDLERLAKTLPL